MSRLRRGFTLIELLVVIAIIAILAAILFPVFVTVKERARIANCTSNMRQLAVALQVYNDDSDGVYPPWLASLYYAKYATAKGVFICPSDPWNGNTQWGPGDWEGSTQMTPGVSYAYMPRASFWLPLWEGANPDTIDPNVLTDTRRWKPRFGGNTPIMFCWWHQQRQRTYTEPTYTEKKFPTLVALCAGSVRKCKHERFMPCASQFGTATDPMQVLY